MKADEKPTKEALIKRLEDEVEYRIRTAVALSKGGHGIGAQVIEGRASVRDISAGFICYEDQGPAASCHLCVGAGGYEDHDGEWAKCSCQRSASQAEPSDAQVEAAGALLYGISWGTDIADPDLVRDALRAARGAK